MTDNIITYLEITGILRYNLNILVAPSIHAEVSDRRNIKKKGTTIKFELEVLKIVKKNPRSGHSWYLGISNCDTCI